MKFSIIVPTYNEENDIVGTLEALIRLDYLEKEILVVDDSTDRTPELVKRYADRGVRLIHPGGGGRCEARNLGITEATGDVVCILNADVRLPQDFLRRIALHYEAGYDFVLVDSRVSNMGDLFARYVGCAFAHLYNADTDPDRMDWTEGFSCRREIALRVGLFPTGKVVPICAGEDGYFGRGLRRAGARKKIDLSIVVEHISPAAFAEYWRIRKGRGEGSAQVHRLLDGWSYPRLCLWNALKTARTLVYALTVIPAVWICWRAARLSPRGYTDIVPFLFAWAVEQAAFYVGEWQATFLMLRKER